MARRPKPTSAKPSRTKAASAKRTKAASAGPNRSKPASRRLIPGKGIAAVVRMYRIGHGDCFLLAFAGEKPTEPVYVLIDCGYKPGSQDKLLKPTSAKAVAENIIAATGGRVHVAVITHEHQDHCNGINDDNFAELKIDEVWLAWTEDPKDELANRLRARFKDQLLGLAGANGKLAGLLGVGPDDEDKDDPRDSSNRKRAQELRRTVREMLELELGDADGFAFGNAFGAAKDPSKSVNKKAMALFKRLAGDNVDFHLPHDRIRTIEGARQLRVFSLGPPRDEKKLKSLDPAGKEEFHVASGFASPSAYFGAAAGSGATGDGPPFPDRFAILRDRALSADADPDDEVASFFREHYGTAPMPDFDDLPAEVGFDEEWRRIDQDWLESAGALALAMNSQTNNASLVLAFELGKGGKVLLFAADAQAGNWRSWADKDWKDGDDLVTTRDLLARTVLYKVGHHGSHNATLAGAEDDPWPNVSWMARGRHGREFVAMITAVEAWARQTPKPDWDHPLKSIKDTLLAKASGRVLQTDTDLASMKASPNSDPAEWQDFATRLVQDDDHLYFDLAISA